MKRENRSFFFKFACILLALFIFLFCIVMPQYTEAYNAAILDKVNRLASIEGPKIVLIGDSNVAFGYNSEMLERALVMPVVNFGVQERLGQAFIADMVKPYIEEGDLLILAPSSYSRGDERIADPVMGWVTLENHLNLWRAVRPLNYWPLANAYPTYLKRALHRFFTGTGKSEGETNYIYRRDAFNLYGDIGDPHTERDAANWDGEAYFISDGVSNSMAAYWNELAVFAETRGATVVMSCPPILEESLDCDLDALQMELENKLEFPVISTLRDRVYPIDRFYNSGLHLNESGAVTHTEKLIADLEAFLENR